MNAGEFVATLVLRLSPSSRALEKCVGTAELQAVCEALVNVGFRPLYELMPSENQCVVLETEGFASGAPVG